MSTQRQAEHLLKQHGLRKTTTRLQILSAFIQSTRALHHGELESQLPDIDRITLYRTLKSFEESGIIHKALDSTQQQRFALCTDSCSHEEHAHDHIHFHCTQCDQTMCLDEKVPTPRLPQGFHIHATHFAVDGICPQCN